MRKSLSVLQGFGKYCDEVSVSFNTALAVLSLDEMFNKIEK